MTSDLCSHLEDVLQELTATLNALKRIKKKKYHGNSLVNIVQQAFRPVRVSLGRINVVIVCGINGKVL